MRLKEPIDATKYDIRILWTGLKEEHVSPDVGVVEGYPLDPPDTGPGWLLVDWGVESLKDVDRYWTLWIREKTKVAKKRGRPAAVQAAATAPPKARKPRKSKQRAEDPVALSPETPEPSAN